MERIHTFSCPLHLLDEEQDLSGSRGNRLDNHLLLGQMELLTEVHSSCTLVVLWPSGTE